jgi:aspartate aminotransferase-like enzyme
VLLAQGSPLVYHRGVGFGRLMRDVTARLKELYRTDDADVLLMTSSGTGGLESAIQNVFSPGDEVLVPLAGYFSERWTKLAKAHGLVVRNCRVRLGPQGRPSVAQALAEHPVKAVLLTHSETSTGAIQPLRDPPGVAKAGALVIADVVSSLGRCRSRSTRIDVAVGGRRRRRRRRRARVRRDLERAWPCTERDDVSVLLDWSIYRKFAERAIPRTRGPRDQRDAGLHAALELYFQTASTSR